MTQTIAQVPWTDEQWARVNQVIREEANRARVAATFLPLVGPLEPSEDFVRADVISYKDQPQGLARLAIDDTDVIKLVTLQVKVYLRGAQMADPDMTSALALFRRAANVLGRLEDAIVFCGQPAPGPLSSETADVPATWKSLRGWEMLAGQKSPGLLDCGEPAAAKKDSPHKKEDAQTKAAHAAIKGTRDELGAALVSKVSDLIGYLEGQGQFGPFAVVLGHDLFTAVQSSTRDSLVLPQERIVPFLGTGGALVRSSTIPPDGGVVVALGGAPVELVIATDVSVNFLQLTTDPWFVFRVYEKMVLRIKEAEAIVPFHWTTHAG